MKEFICITFDKGWLTCHEFESILHIPVKKDTHSGFIRTVK